LHQKSDDTLKNFLNHKDTKNTKMIIKAFVTFAPSWFILIFFELLEQIDAFAVRMSRHCVDGQTL
jgi:hypothetical protein